MNLWRRRRPTPERVVLDRIAEAKYMAALRGADSPDSDRILPLIIRREKFTTPKAVQR